MGAVTPGVCRYCGCTDGAPCWSCRQHHDDCAFRDRDRTVCQGPDCVKAEAARIQSLRKPRPFDGWGPGAIRIEKRRIRRNARQREARGQRKRRAA